MRSPGRPEPSRAVQRQFWRLIASGITSAEAAVKVGVSVPVGTRWFRHAGGMPPISLAEPTGRYLSFEEREEIALLRAKQVGVREVARRVGRDPGTISRELRRNAATRSGEAGVSGAGGAMEGAAGGQAPEDGEARDQSTHHITTGEPQPGSASRPYRTPADDHELNSRTGETLTSIMKDRG